MAQLQRLADQGFFDDHVVCSRELELLAEVEFLVGEVGVVDFGDAIEIFFGEVRAAMVLV